MKKIASTLASLGCFCLLLPSCNTASPDDYFARAVLNSNMLVGFANNGLERELDQPSVKMVDGDVNRTEPMKRKEIIDGKIQYMEEQLGKIKNLKVTEDTKEMLDASVSLHEHVLPVFKNEYQQLAKLYDDGAPKEQIQSLTQSIHDKFYPRFDELYNKLIAVGKVYAAKHSIKVNWGQ
jgi:hypothetical protein